MSLEICGYAVCVVHVVRMGVSRCGLLHCAQGGALMSTIQVGWMAEFAMVFFSGEFLCRCCEFTALFRCRNTILYSYHSWQEQKLWGMAGGENASAMTLFECLCTPIFR